MNHHSIRHLCRLILTLLVTAISGGAAAQDTIAPVLSLNPASPGCIELGCQNPPYIDPGATAMDNIDGNLTSAVQVKGFVDTRRKGWYTLTYSVKDKAGNETVMTRNVCVEYSRRRGFFISPISTGFVRIWTDYGMGFARKSFKWYIDGKYLKGYDNVFNLYYDYKDTAVHEVCMEEFLCEDDSAYPYCLSFGDTSFKSSKYVMGRMLVDKNGNCSYDSTESPRPYMKINLFDSSNQLVESSYSFIDGSYLFNFLEGKYRIEIDTTGFPVDINCPYPGIDSSFEITKGKNGQVEHINFMMSCKPGFDIGTHGARIYPIQPGQDFKVIPRIGDMNYLFGMNCIPDNINSMVRIQVSGKVRFSGKLSDALNPDSVSGNTITYLIQDFTKLDNRSFGMKFTADTTAVPGVDSVRVSIEVTPKQGDLKPENNTKTIVVLVGGSYDPNFKQVYPADVIEHYAGWLTYTVHFQNTGNAPAFKVRVTDTLDNELDPSTFEILDFSHTMQTSLKGQALNFYFPDINLADSFSNEPASHGYVQYRVKPLKNLKAGTQILNKAFIYFDYNEPVVTNTTVNNFYQPPMGISRKTAEAKLSVFPNPGTGIFTVVVPDVSEDCWVEVYNIYGAVVYSSRLYEKEAKLDLRLLPDGYYLLKVGSGPEIFNKGLVKQ